MERIVNLIDGVDAEPAEGEFLDVLEPASGRVWARVADSSAADVEAAVTAAAGAFPSWSTRPAAERSALMLALADAIDARLDEFARLECIDGGKPIDRARKIEIPRAVSNLRFFATAILHESSQSHSTDRIALNYTLRRPRGVAVTISPWNLPLYLFTWKIAPALATGNTVVAKPSELTPATAARLGTLSREVGFPPGVLNIVHGRGARCGAALVADPRVPTISFTGGTVTGAAIAASAAPRFKKLSLELGGKNPNLVFADADLDEAVDAAVLAGFSNQGQICLCGSRLLVERPIYDRFVERLLERVARLRIGDPLEPGVDQGALISSEHRDKVRSYVELARREGGRVRCGGNPPPDLPARCREGFFLEPTVITDLPADCRVDREEIFGPVLTVRPFDSEAQAVAEANATPYGLSATLWTRDLSRAHRLAEQIDAGTVWINCWLLRDLRVPFGGMKSSGVGREGGDEALRFFTEPKNVCVRIPPS